MKYKKSQRLDLVRLHDKWKAGECRGERRSVDLAEAVPTLVRQVDSLTLERKALREKLAEASLRIAALSQRLSEASSIVAKDMQVMPPKMRARHVSAARRRLAKS